MSTKDVIIAGQKFILPIPYAVGHALTEGEAKALNQTFHENIRNNTAKLVKEAGDNPDLNALQVKITEYANEYSFPVAGTPRAPVDPVEREARVIAKEYLKAHLAQTNRNFKSVPEGYTEETWAAAIEENLDKIATSDKVMAMAKKSVADKKKRLETLAGELEL